MIHDRISLVQLGWTCGQPYKADSGLAKRS
jgi:hypothetical protein